MYLRFCCFFLFRKTFPKGVFFSKRVFFSKGSKTDLFVSGDGWHSFMEDQLALLDHLGVENCLLLGGRTVCWELGVHRGCVVTNGHGELMVFFVSRIWVDIFGIKHM